MKQDLKERAEQNKTHNKAIEKKWVLSKTPSQIITINAARRSLTRLRGKHISLIEDERIPKRPIGAYMLYSEEQRTTGNWAGLSAKDIVSKVGEGWRALSESEKKVYGDAYLKSKAEYDAKMAKLS